MRFLFLLASLLTFPLMAAATLDGVDLGAYVHGPKVTAADLRGRVVLFEYWGVNCPPCLASIKHLASWQAAYDRDSLVIVANHCQGGGTDNARTVWLSKGGGDQISVVDSGELRGSNVSGIPHCFLFDHEGRLIYDGSPFKVEALLKEALAAAPGHLVAGYDWKLLAREAQAVGRREKLAATLKAVRKYQEGSDAAAKTEADALMERITTWHAAQVQAMTEARAADPATAMRIATQMATALKGDVLAAPFDAMVTEIKADKAAMKIIQADVMLEKIKSAAEACGLAADPKTFVSRPGNRAKLEEIAGGLKTLLSKYADTPAAEEARALIATWGLGG